MKHTSKEVRVEREERGERGGKREIIKIRKRLQIEILRSQQNMKHISEKVRVEREGD